ncbi:MAG: sensor histidine kinase [Thermoleophilaceae bacterium]|nr:sensor histidine kinase [Thermoleophilaceae bacterium]
MRVPRGERGRRALSEGDWRTLDRLLVAGLIALAEIELATLDDIDGPRWLNALIVVAMGLSLLLRRTRPFTTLVLVVGFGVFAEIVAFGPPDLLSMVFMLIAATYSMGAHAERRRSFEGIAVGVVGVTIIAALFDPGDIVFPVVLFVIAPWLTGRALRNHLVLTRELAEKAEQLAHQREQEEQRAVTAERRRIARELHDVLAHNLSVMVVQASGGGRMVARDPERAAEVARLIESTGRDAMVELRHMFGAVRRDEGEPLDGPPSLARVERLAQRARDAGLPVEVIVEGEAEPLPPGVDLAAYRVVQEALTNSYKHAGPAHARVHIRYEPHELLLEVSDDGVGAGEAGDLGGGHGLVGMKERVALYGGDLEAGRARGGGFAVRAKIPLVARAVAR